MEGKDEERHKEQLFILLKIGSNLLRSSNIGGISISVTLGTSRVRSRLVLLVTPANQFSLKFQEAGQVKISTHEQDIWHVDQQ